MIEDLKKYLVDPRDKNQKILDALDEKEKISEWYAGSQLEALKYYLTPEVKIVSSYKQDDYQGSVFAILFVDDKFFLWRDSFGSCSGCDAIADCDEEGGYDYIINTMTSVKEFDTLDEVWLYLEKPDDYFYESEQGTVIKELKKNHSKFSPPIS